MEVHTLLSGKPFFFLLIVINNKEDDFCNKASITLYIINIRYFFVSEKVTSAILLCESVNFCQTHNMKNYTLLMNW